MYRERVEIGPGGCPSLAEESPAPKSLLDPGVRDVGVGYAAGPRDRLLYWVLDLGARFAAK